MKILKRNYIHRNLLFFLVASVVFQEAIKSISYGQSLITDFSIANGSWFDLLLWGANLAALFAVYKVSKLSDKLVLLTITLVSIKNFYLLSTSFNKLVLGLSFVYLLFAFYFYISWELELKRACFRPKFFKNDLVKGARAITKIIFKINEQSYEAYLTNMDETSAFVIFENESPQFLNKGFKKTDIVSITCLLDSVEFHQNVRIVSRYDQGLGLEYLKTKQDAQVYDYPELFRIYLDRGVFI